MAESVGDLLKRFRAAAGLTQEELAENAEVSARTVSDVERGLRTRIYRDTASRLADALALTADAREVFLAVSRGRGPARSAAAVPVPPTRLIGRDAEVELIRHAIADTGARVVTVTGPGGIGKTRIALEAARLLQDRWDVAVVELGSLRDPAYVLPAIRHAVGASVDSAASIAAHVSGRRCLVVCDTFEHVLTAAGDIAVLVAAAPDIAFLVTSREALRIRGEHEVAISTLPLPESPDALKAAPATALFLERARSVAPQAIDEADAGLVLDICRKLNGLPLAIELAAARTKHLSLAELRENLERRLDVLTGGPRDLPRRQRTMRDAVAWSSELLDDGERSLFHDLSVFAGGWTLDAAAAVAVCDDVLDGVSALIDKSLVRRSDAGRYDMLDVIRDYAAEEGETRTDALDRHLGYFTALAERAEPELGAREQHGWMARLAADHDNIRAALRRAIDVRDARSALRLASAVWRFWLFRSDLAEGRAWLRAALELPDAPDELRAKALWGASWLAYHHGDYAAAEQLGDRLPPLADGLRDPIVRRNALTISGLVALAQGRADDAVRVFTDAVDALSDADAGWLIPTSILTLGMAKIHAGVDAQTDLAEARRRYEELGDEHFVARSVLYTGYAALVRGDVAEARTCFLHSLVDFWELDDLWGTAEALEGVAAAFAAGGEVAPAARAAGAAAALRERTGSVALPADRDLAAGWLVKAAATGGWQAAYDEGLSATTENAVADAVGHALS